MPASHIKILPRKKYTFIRKLLENIWLLHLLYECLVVTYCKVLKFSGSRLCTLKVFLYLTGQGVYIEDAISPSSVNDFCSVVKYLPGSRESDKFEDFHSLFYGHVYVHRRCGAFRRV